ncbi:sugar-binding domain-containing protein [Mucilaginibacter gossypii]|uniref:beta-galactosidase n=1 Tax=Mucilaginibacter gossypii TaxID=551996 RepID=A0A1G7TMB4_9SPHI|nr:sugar-binding domain-containing protein [Mucilaginibacter gossypii]SDG36483.1 Glycosyl hydrolases family 2, TIM barrel domain [Mucilaginibacter gossypii]
MMQYSLKKTFFLLAALVASSTISAQVKPIPVAGKWLYRLDSLDKGLDQKWQQQQFTNSIWLPGTLDDAGIGAPVKVDTTVLSKDIMLHLSRKHRYTGAVWYQRSINLTSRMANALLSLERVIWKTDCWIDGKPAGTQESLIAPQVFKLGPLAAGKHVITIRVDNRKQHDISVNDFAHAYTDGTQIIWNGVIGKMQLIDIGKQVINQVQVYSSLANHSVKAAISLGGSHSGDTYLRAFLLSGKKIVKQTSPTVIQHNQEEISLQVPEAQSWDEFHPRLYSLRTEVIDSKGQVLDARTQSFGFRDINATGNELRINDRPLFLRGTLECNIFPLEGHPPMNTAGWLKVFKTAKAYGLNHLRFHSWCPPEAAFQVADSLGFYLHVELPLWVLTVGKDPKTLTYLEQEAENIIRNYGNHPSFCFWSMGNELEGDFGWLEKLVRKLKQEDNRHLYTTTTFSFQKGHGKNPDPADDYFITQYTEKGWVRGQGIFNTNPPDFKTDYSKALKGTTVPLIIHEVGQYSVYPDLEEIKKYTGVLRPSNFEAVRNNLRKKGMLGLAPDYLKASGTLAVQLYKEEIERALKTKGVGGFQLLDLHDFPGQGTALVGILNAFWDSKGLVSSTDFSKFCGPVVPLIRFEKAAYSNNEHFYAAAEIANYSDRQINGEVLWSAISSDKHFNLRGSLGRQSIAIGNASAGSFSIDLSKIDRACELQITVSIANTGYTNYWKIWVYPDKKPESFSNVIFTTSIDSALSYLQAGRKVLLNPDTANVKGIDGRFAPVFWSPVHFPDQPGSMGLLIDKKSNALADFPTDFYTDWQWWDLVTRSRSLILDKLGAPATPIVRVIDNFFRNRNLATLVEFKVGSGSLILCTMDLHSQLTERAAARQLRYSLLHYAAGNTFQPVQEISAGDLRRLLDN